MAKTICGKSKAGKNIQWPLTLTPTNLTHTHIFKHLIFFWDIQSRLVYHNHICSLNIYCKNDPWSWGRKKLKPIHTWISPLIKLKAYYCLLYRVAAKGIQMTIKMTVSLKSSWPINGSTYCYNYYCCCHWFLISWGISG